MPREFTATTAEQVVGVVAAVSSSNRACDPGFIGSFLDTSEEAAEAALMMATDIGLVSENAGVFSEASPLCRFLRTPAGASRAAILRVALESYEPFTLFRQRLIETGRPEVAAQQTKTMLDLTATRSQVADTLISLGTFAGSIQALGAGQYNVPRSDDVADLSVLAAAAEEEHAAEAVVRNQLGQRTADAVSHIEVLRPLTKALVHARAGQGDAAVQEAGNAVESFLTEYGNRHGVNTSAQHGVNAKAGEIANAGHLPPKLKAVSFYLGHLRNAADHGIDADIGSSWQIRDGMALAYVFVCCHFISACVSRETGSGHVL